MRLVPGFTPRRAPRSRPHHTAMPPAGLRAALLLLAGLAGAQLPGAAPAQELSPVPARRAVATSGVDFFGADLRSILDTELRFCDSACRADASCTAFTYNLSASACFLKSGPGEERPFAGALSARVLDVPAATRQTAAARASSLTFLPRGRLQGAAALARSLPYDYPAPPGAAPAAAGSPVAAAAATAAAEDTAEAWLALARAAAMASERGGQDRYQLAELSLNAAVNAVLRAGPPELAATALDMLAARLEAAEEGEAALGALKLAASLSPAPEIAEALERARRLWGFRILDQQVEADSAAPRLCIRFSAPLAPAGVDYAPFVQMGGPALPAEPEGDRLCIEGLAHGETYALTLRRGLPARDGETLRTAATIEAYLPDRAPAVRFPARAWVLPRSAEAALPVITVNTDTVRLRISRVPERGLVDTLRNGRFLGALDAWDERRIAQDSGALVWEGTGDVARRDNAEVTTLLPLGAAIPEFEPGVYLMTARTGADEEDWQSAATQWFVVTDIGVATLGGADGLHVFARSLGEATPLEGLTVKLLARNNDLLGTARTDASGAALFAPGLTRGAGGMAPAAVTLEGPDGDFAFLSLEDAPLDLSDRGVSGRPAPGPVDVFLSLDRGAYRPGETMHATVLARDAQAKALPGLPLTAILTRPDGVEATRRLLADAGAGGHVFDAALPAGAMRGTWSLRIHADPEAPALAETALLVEDFEPERIDFDLTLPDALLDPAALPPLGVTARYLYGAPGAGLEAEGELVLARTDRLEAWPGYRFGLAEESIAPVAAPFAPGLITGPEGRLSLALPTPEVPPVSGLLTLTARLRLAEGSGRPVEREITRALRPEGPRIGLKPLFEGNLGEGATAAFEAIALAPGADGTLAPATLTEVRWTLSRLHITYQWYQDGQDWRYETLTRPERVAAGTVSLAPGTPARIEAPVDWGRYALVLTAPDGGGIATSVTFSAGWNTAAAGTDTPDRLEAALDKPRYAVGETARLHLVPREAGEVLVQVITDRLVAMRAVRLGAEETTVSLPVTDDWAPGAYVSATLIRPADAGAGRNPTRAIGIGWAGIEPGAGALDARFTSAQEARPRAPYEAVLEVEGLAPGETAHATLAAVDLGILNLTGFETPDPLGHYWGQRRLGMEMRDLYGRLIDGFTGETGALRSGGDSSPSRLQAPAPTQELLARFAGPLTVGADGTLRVPLDVPAFNGTMRLMAVVWSASGVGAATSDVLVRDPVVMSEALPRFLAPGDESRLGLTLTHASGPAGEVSVRVQGTGVEIPAQAREQVVTLAEGGRATLDIPLTAGAAGPGHIDVSLTTPGGETLDTRLALDVMANDLPVARQTRVEIPPGGSLTLGADAFDGLVPGTASATLALGPAARFDVPGLLLALDRYPYGCTEQLASAALPLLYLGDMAAAAGMDTPSGLAARIEKAIAGVLANQSGSGAFGLWGPGDGDLWLDAYVTDFLSRARATGHTVPDVAFRMALGNLRNRVSYAGDFEHGGEGIAYALMVLAREGVASTGDLRYYADTRAHAFATPLALAQLGTALAYYGDQPRADALFRRAATLLGAGEADDTLWRVDYGSTRRDAAGVLALAAEVNSTAVDREALARQITRPGPLSERSTQENAWALLAARALLEGGAVEATLDGAPLTGPAMRRLPAPAEGAPGTVIGNAGAAPLEAVVTTLGVPDQPEPAGGNGYRITRDYYHLDGTPADLTALRRSERLVAVLTVTPERDTNARLMVDDPLPAGLEIDNPNLLRAGDIAGLDWLGLIETGAHTEARAERFLAAVDWSGDAPLRLAYVLRAVSPGVFRQPAASVEDMYRPAYRARTAAGEVTVRP
ncbi:alpha-2-macroglobulin family protein [Oceanicella sp. SM1341]|uniref:alpha-2-macroglobulin family protein n=1 Tax=Oceanicella sp. SM1341 TaxID=1548889 RepID=UPI001E3E4B17|nr:alpha-2-macroglobulin family protein [Oceanicella sp. SM1341]